MSIYRRMRGLPDRKLLPLLQGHQALHARTFVWTIGALVWCALLTIAGVAHLVGAL